MDNMNQPPGGDPPDHWPTKELGPTAGLAGPAGPSGPRPQRGGRLRGGPLWWGAGLALVALLVGGGALAATSGPSPSPAGPTGQAAVLNTMLDSASSPGADGVLGSAETASATSAAPCLSRAAKLKAAGHPLAAGVALWRCRHRLRLVPALGGLHGQFTFETKTSTRTLASERGVIQSVSGIDMVAPAKYCPASTCSSRARQLHPPAGTAA